MQFATAGRHWVGKTKKYIFKEKIMEGKKKLIIALSSVCGVLFAAVIAMGIVWAATSQTVTSTIRVNYVASDVIGSISGKTFFNSDTGTAMSGGSPTGTYSFDATTGGSASGSLTPAATTLLNENGKTFVIYEYAITNSAAASSMDASLAYADSTTSPDVADANIKVYAYVNTTASQEGDQVSSPFTNVSTIKGTADANLVANPASLFSSVEIPHGETYYFYVVVALDNPANDAEFSGTFTWTLTKHVSA